MNVICLSCYTITKCVRILHTRSFVSLEVIGISNGKSLNSVIKEEEDSAKAPSFELVNDIIGSFPNLSFIISTSKDGSATLTLFFYSTLTMKVNL
jgi:hypothetical protein